MGSEREIVAKLRRRSHKLSGLKVGIGDDCAVYQPAPYEDLVFTTDFLIENVHFLRATHSAQDVGYKALARGLSDLAATGATPRFCLLSLALPPWATADYADDIFTGLLDLADRTECELAGGDLAAAPILICDIVACGSAPRGQALLRSGARAGDEIWVSGPLGGSALGFETGSGAAWKKHLRPEPRISTGLALRGLATAAMDLSDGLSLDLARLSTESGLAAEIGPPPLFPGATLDQALHGGEDYELLFTVPPGSDLPGEPALWLHAARVGRMVEGPPGQVTLGSAPLPALGYDHFRQP